MPKILTLGEPLIIHYLQEATLTSESSSFFSLGGSEINTSISLANNNNQVYLISSLPKNELGKEFLDILQTRNIQTKYIHLSEEHQIIGSMYVKNNHVFYQRQYSCFSFLNLMNIDLESIFSQQFDWCHLTCITPLLSVGNYLIWRELIENCIISKISISLDLNYRSSLREFEYLWQLVKPFLSNLELFIISISDISLIANIEKINISKLSFEEQLLLLSKRLHISKLVVCKKDILSDRTQNRSSYLVYQEQIYQSKIKNHAPKEFIGGGDAFVGSLINSFLKNNLNQIDNISIQNILEIADHYTIDTQNEVGNFPKF